ncbi:MAG: flavohemoprotein [Deltaproteobacteria bacterium]|nr:flavohemoprotein [Deltaproteobacteria bacterium]
MNDFALLSENLELVASRDYQLAQRLYTRLFERHPELRALFGAHSSPTREEMLTETLLGAVDSLDGASWLESNLQLLGAKHTEFEVRDEMYEWWSECVLDVLEEVSGADWTSRLARLWRERLDHLCAHMREGARENPST